MRFFLRCVISLSISIISVTGLTAQYSERSAIKGPAATMQRGGASSNGGSITISAPTTVKNIPSTFTIPISVDDVTGQDIISYQFNILYDATKIDPTGANFGCSSTGTLSGVAAFAVFCNVVAGQEGILRISAFGTTTTLTGSGTLLNLTFQTDNSAAAGNVSPLNFDAIFIFNNSSTMLPNTPVNGQVTLVVAGPTAATTSIAGVAMSAAGQPVFKARISLTDGNGETRTVLSNAFGFYQFDTVPVGEIYVVSALAKRYTFVPQTVSVTDQVTSLNFIADQ